jgi:Double-GTPase 2
VDVIRAIATFLYAVLAGLASALIGVVACTGQACVEYMIAGVQVLYTRPDELPVRRYIYTVPAGSDPARPNYFYGPARSDLRYIRQVARSRWQDAAEWWQETVASLLNPESFSERVTVPVAVGLTIGLIVALPFAALLTGAVCLAHEMLVDVATVGMRFAATTLRIIDSGLLFARHIRVRCVACFEQIPYPAYLCPNPACKHTHWDIRPGMFGVLHRTCECGTRMPTLLLLGTAARLDAICSQRACGHPLEYRPGEMQEIVLPIFGSKGAGKTRLLYGIIKTLYQSVRLGVHVEPADSATADRLRDLESLLTDGSPLLATPAAATRAYVLRLRIGRHRRIVQLIDAAGELFYTSERSADLIFLGNATTFTMVIDPLSISVFWDSLPSAQRHRLAPDRSEAPDPRLAYQQTADRIKEMGRRHAARRLAIVFSRADLLGTECGPGVGAGERIRNWAANDLGLAGLLRQAESDFREVALFHTAAFGSDENTLTTLIHWLMRAEGITPTSLPAAFI